MTYDDLQIIAMAELSERPRESIIIMTIKEYAEGKIWQLVYIASTI